MNDLNKEIQFVKGIGPKRAEKLHKLNIFTLKDLIYEVLNPIGYNLIVTTKEIDYLVEKFGKLISEALNISLNDL